MPYGQGEEAWGRSIAANASTDPFLRIMAGPPAQVPSLYTWADYDAT